MPENVVLGFCTNMPPEGPEVLCRSIREHLSPESTEIVLITNEPERYEESLRGLHVSYRWTPSDMTRQTTKFEKLSKRLAVHGARVFGRGFLDRALAGGAIGRLYDTLAEAWCHPMIGRWYGYAAAIAERPSAKRFLLTDTKDVLVQADCFSALRDDEVLIFRENEFFGDSYWNSKWVEDGFGAKALAQLVGKEAVCVGTVLGAREPTLTFVRQVADYFRRYPFRAVEQGTINWLLHAEGDPAGTRRVDNVIGPVTTLSNPTVRERVFERDGRIYRLADETPCPVVHMWDRWGELDQAVRARYLGTRA